VRLQVSQVDRWHGYLIVFVRVWDLLLAPRVAPCHQKTGVRKLMARCSNCGRVNRESSAFCEGCGTRLSQEAPVRAPTPVSASGPGASVACGACGAENPPGMNFCRACGTPLR